MPIANREPISATTADLGIASGATFAIRWVDPDATAVEGAPVLA